MGTLEGMIDPVVQYVCARSDLPEQMVRGALRPVRGGLESSVTRAQLPKQDGTSGLPHRFIVKELRGSHQREAAVYSLLWARLPNPPAARLLDVQLTPGAVYLYLEDVQRRSAWPWADAAAAAAVCRELARLHDSDGMTSQDALAWDYDAELQRSAEATAALAINAIDTQGARYWRRAGDLKRVIAALPALRARLRADGVTVIHGDAHPGNVLFSGRGQEARVTFIDWGRARVGSPLEDLASWLHSLGCWDVEAGRHHDTLLRVYLAHRQPSIPLTARVRETYWLACASNGLAGAIRYHLAVAADTHAPPSARRDSACALRAWTRVIRRAAEILTARGGD
jgi:aminoglycoside phosphotransferase (APT) family kinase protein